MELFFVFVLTALAGEQLLNPQPIPEPQPEEDVEVETEEEGGGACERNPTGRPMEWESDRDCRLEPHMFARNLFIYFNFMSLSVLSQITATGTAESQGQLPSQYVVGPRQLIMSARLFRQCASLRRQFTLLRRGSCGVSPSSPFHQISTILPQ